MIAIKKILMPTDFSEYALKAKPYAVELAKKFGAKVTALHVITPPSYAGTFEVSIDLTSLNAELQKSAEKRMSELKAELEREGIKAETAIKIGSGFVEIVAYARESEADLIVMATHGWGMLKHMMLGSTAEKVVRKAPCPVLTIRSPEHEFVHP